MRMSKIKIFILVLLLSLLFISKLAFGEDSSVLSTNSLISNSLTENIFKDKYSVKGRFNTSINFSPIGYAILGSETIKLSDKQLLSLTESVIGDFNKSIDKLIEKVKEIPPDVMVLLSEDLQNKLKEENLKDSGISIDLLEQFLTEFDTRVPNDLAKEKDRVVEMLPNGLEALIRGMMQKPMVPKTFGLSFGLDYTVFKWLSPTVDIGFVIIERNMLGYFVNIATIPWAVGARIYPALSAPYGFFLYPKFGGTHLSFNIRDSFNNNYIINTKEHGLYLALELGYRIKLFPKSMANSRVNIGIDISFLDIGYYFNSWDSKILNKDIVFLNNNFKLSDIFKNGTDKILDIRLLLLPRIGVSLRF